MAASTERVAPSTRTESLFFAGIMVRLEQINRADTVTGLLNRAQFERAVKGALNEFRRTGVTGAILLLFSLFYQLQVDASS